MNRCVQNSRFRKAIAIAAVAAMSFLPSLAGTVHTYTTAGTVSDVISGDDSVVVNCPDGTVTFTGANTYTGGTTIQAGTVGVANRQALGTGAIACSSGTRLEISCSWRGTGSTLTADVLDKIAVSGDDAWVSIRLAGDGLKNDVDFTGKPALWLSAVNTEDGTGRSNILQGIFEPNANCYQFGYGGGTDSVYFNKRHPIIVTNLVDAANGDARSIRCRGAGTTMIPDPATFGGRIDYSGPVIIDASALVCVETDAAFGRCPDKPTDKLILNAGATYKSGALNIVHGANFGLVVNGSAKMVIPVGNASGAHETFNGPFSGSGDLVVYDYGGLAFPGDQTTFTGRILVNNYATAGYRTYIYVGAGNKGTWDIDILLWNGYQGVVFVGDADVNFTADIGSCLGSAAGSVIKRGSGKATISSTLTDTHAAGSIPFIHVEEGTLCLAAQQSAYLSPVVVEKGAVLDLGGLAWTGFYLPSGAGTVKNWSGVLPLSATCADAEKPIVFSGKLEGAVAVTTKDDWRPSEATIADLTVPGGSAVTLGPATKVTKATVELGGRLNIGKTTRNPTDSLKAQYWMAGDTFKNAETVADCLQLAYDRFHSASPSYSLTTNTDTFVTYNSKAAGYFDTGMNYTDDERNAPIGCWPIAAKLGVSYLNYFAVSYSGYLTLADAGTCQFQAVADTAITVLIDGQKVVENMAGYAHPSRMTTGDPVELAAGLHAIEVHFVDKTATAKENFSIRLKSPGSEEFAMIPLTALSETDYVEETALPAVVGAGTIALAEGGTWPSDLGLSGFTGTILVNDAAASAESGTLAPGKGKVLFSGKGSVLGGDWSPSGVTAVTNLNGGMSFQMTVPVEKYGTAPSTAAYLNSGFNVPLDKAWTVEFDYLQASPYHNWWNYACWVVGLHDVADADLWHGKGGFNAKGGGLMGSNKKIYGLQMATETNWYTYDYWLKDGNVHESYPDYVSMPFSLNNDADNPYHVKVAYDTQKLVVTFTRLSDASMTVSVTNTLAGTELPALYPNGARFGIWSRTWNGYYDSFVYNLKYDEPGATVKDQTFGGKVALADGETLAVVKDGLSGTCTLASSIELAGAATVNAAGPVTFGSTYLRSDFTSAATPKLTLTGDVTFGSNTVTLDFLGDVPKQWTSILDASALESATLPTFEFSSSLPAKTLRHLRQKIADGILSVRWESMGMAVIFW